MFDASGAKVGIEFAVHTEDFCRSDLCALANGGFVHTWTSSDYRDVWAQLFDAAGEKLGAQFRVNTSDFGQATSVTALSNGGFVVAWSGGGDSKAQVFDGTGAKVSAEFSITQARGLPL